MENIIEKSVIEGKLAELEQELFALEKAFKEKAAIENMERKLMEDASQIDQHLTEIISCLDIQKETQRKNDTYRTHASCFSIAAPNI
ncbi:hypothetical protein WQ54_30030 [Bacillus sp. SA1-12]|uniref:hypothetical protein n=1 Tax=Bacillus sp. SA1-12 TaxID=1455638 RepID=UPI0006274387|nr:hypothetical protein [Bacillus sp. SA1-12]KKI88750.1 hypothetical protein WQ54_30030 [Bacillus sp. SA1-12]